jgi:exopolysaccharide production repressor protein
MSLPRFLVGMFSVLVVFAISTYVATGSIGRTLVQTLICAVLLQLGYFLVVLFLVAREGRKTEREKAEIRGGEPARLPETESLVGRIRHLTDLLRSRHP